MRGVVYRRDARVPMGRLCSDVDLDIENLRSDFNSWAYKHGRKREIK